MRTRELKAAARAAGKRAGTAAGSWAIDGNTSVETCRRILVAFDEGDPAFLDSFRYPDLSGEFSGDPTLRSLMEDLGLEEGDPRYEWLESDLCDAWTDAATLAFEREVIRACRYQTARYQTA
jgi:hypothetical protein